MNRQPTFAFPDLCDGHANALCDFLCQLAADADAHYVAQIIRYRKLNQPPPPDPDHPWRREPPVDS